MQEQTSGGVQFFLKTAGMNPVRQGVAAAIPPLKDTGFSQRLSLAADQLDAASSNNAVIVRPGSELPPASAGTLPVPGSKLLARSEQSGEVDSLVLTVDTVASKSPQLVSAMTAEASAAVALAAEKAAQLQGLAVTSAEAGQAPAPTSTGADGTVGIAGSDLPGQNLPDDESDSSTPEVAVPGLTVSSLDTLENADLALASGPAQSRMAEVDDARPAARNTADGRLLSRASTAQANLAGAAVSNPAAADAGKPLAQAGLVPPPTGSPDVASGVSSRAATHLPDNGMSPVPAPPAGARETSVSPGMAPVPSAAGVVVPPAESVAARQARIEPSTAGATRVDPASSPALQPAVQRAETGQQGVPIPPRTGEAAATPVVVVNSASVSVQPPMDALPASIEAARAIHAPAQPVGKAAAKGAESPAVLAGGQALTDADVEQLAEAAVVEELEQAAELRLREQSRDTARAESMLAGKQAGKPGADFLTGAAGSGANVADGAASDTLMTLTRGQLLPATGPLAAAGVSPSTADGLAQPASSTAPFSVPLLGAQPQQALAENVRWMVNGNLGSAEINLKPAGMGPVSVKLDMDKDRLHVAIVAPHGVTRDALESLLPRLREHLQSQGHNQVELSVSDRRESPADSRQQSGQQPGQQPGQQSGQPTNQQAPGMANGNGGQGNAGNRDASAERNAQAGPVLAEENGTGTRQGVLSNPSTGASRYDLYV